MEYSKHHYYTRRKRKKQQSMCFQCKIQKAKYSAVL